MVKLLLRLIFLKRLIQLVLLFYPNLFYFLLRTILVFFSYKKNTPKEEGEKELKLLLVCLFLLIKIF